MFFGEVDHDECLSQMAACDIILIPSRDDAMSFVALDALSLGKALVCSRTTGRFGVSARRSIGADPAREYTGRDQPSAGARYRRYQNSGWRWGKEHEQSTSAPSLSRDSLRISKPRSGSGVPRQQLSAEMNRS